MEESYEFRSIKDILPTPGTYEYWAQSFYAISLSQYRELVALANDHCMACGSGPALLYIDHDHTTGKVRGLVCPACNSYLGHLDVDRAKEAIAYLERAEHILNG